MRCTQADLLLVLYADDELDTRQRAALEAHLRRCDRCRHELRMLQAINAILAEPTAIPPDLPTRIMTRIAQSEGRHPTAAPADFGLRWADGLRAGLLATLSTLLFVLLSPALRLTVGGALRGAFPDLVAFLLSPGPGSIVWLAWLGWVVAGLSLTLWLAGPDVRAVWLRSLSSWVAHLPQLRQS